MRIWAIGLFLFAMFNIPVIAGTIPEADSGSVSSRVYKCNSLPIPKINTDNTPYKQVQSVGNYVQFDGSASYAPDGGIITEYKWNIFAYDGTKWVSVFTISNANTNMYFSFHTRGYYKVQLWVKDSTPEGNWNDARNVEEAYVYAIGVKLETDSAIAFGTGTTFRYLIEPVGNMKIYGINMLFMDENDNVVFSKWVDNPVIGKQGFIEWDGIANEGIHTGYPIPAGRYYLRFIVTTSYGSLKKK